MSWRGRKVSSQETQPEPFPMTDDQLALHRHRYREARRAGLGPRDAKLFAAELSMDVGQLRELARRGCPTELMLLIL